jgi:hypothetical protein
MDINLRQIYDYNLCPMIYKFKYIMHIDFEVLDLQGKYDDALRKTIMFMYYQILNGKEPSFDVVRQKFGSLIYKDTNEILTRNTIDKNQGALNYNSVNCLMRLYEHEAAKTFVPILVDSDLSIPIGDHVLLVTVDLMREATESGTKLIEVTKFSNTTKKIDPFFVNHNLELTAYSYGCRKLFEAVEDRVVLYNIRAGKEFYSRRRDTELRRLEATVGSVCNNITNQRFYPVHNYLCSTCKYKDICDKYKF